MLIEKAVDFESGSYRGLFHFVRYIRQLQKYEVDFGEVNIQGEGADTVRIMSIHKSKGLEFPIVFVSGMGKKFNQSDSRAPLVLHAGLGIGADVIWPERRERSAALPKQVMKKAKAMENLAEEMRVLYVALTRAKEKLILTGTVGKLEQTVRRCAALTGREQTVLPYPALSSASSYLDWVLAALSKSRCMIPLYAQYEIKVPGSCPEESEKEQPPVLIRLEQPRDMVSEELLYQMNLEVKKEELKHLDTEKTYAPKLRQILEKNFSYFYPFEMVTHLPVKMTVSELKKKGEEEEEAGERLYEETPYEELRYEPEEGLESGSVQELEEKTKTPEEERWGEPADIVPKFVRKEETILKGAARGTAYHRLLEELDFTEADSKEKIEAQIGRLQDERKLSPEEAACIRPGDLVWFAKGRLGQRVRKAYENGKLYTEQPFVMEVPADEVCKGAPEGETVLVQGIIDAYFEEEGELVIVDYKTDRAPDRDGSFLVERYRKQLLYYREALERMTGKRVKTMYLYSFWLGKALECN